MDEISMFTDLRPAQPAETEADAMRAVVRGRVTGVLRDAEPAAPARRSPARRHRVLIGGGLVTAAVTAAIAIPSLLSGGAFTAKAWAVERNSDGSITIAVTRQFDDPAGLRAALLADGIRAFVTVHREITGNNSGGGYVYDECDYVNLDRAPDAVQNAVITEGPPVSPPPDVVTWGTWIIHPAAMPTGSVLLIASWRSTDGTSIGAMIPIVLRTDKLPVCTPNTTPMLGTPPGVVPGEPPSGQPAGPAGRQASASAHPYPSGSAG